MKVLSTTTGVVLGNFIYCSIAGVGNEVAF